MSTTRAGARAAVAAFFAPPAVVGLNRVYTSFPKSSNLPSNTYTGNTGALSGAVGIVHIVRSTESRIAIGGAHGGIKRTIYDVELQILMRSSQRLAEDSMNDFDAVLDATVSRLRSDRILGTDGLTVWQAGEQMLDVESAEPRITQSVTEIWSAIKFDLSQFQANT